MVEKVQRLDSSNPELVREYEEAFYRAFIELSNPAIRELWDWDDEKLRLKTKISYEEQAIYYVRDKNDVMSTACAFNIGEKSFQSGVYGFEWPSADEKWIEILTLFSGAGVTNKLLILEKARFDLGELGYNACYATSAEKVVKLHTKIGAQIMDQKIYNGQLRLLIKRGFQSSFF